MKDTLLPTPSANDFAQGKAPMAQVRYGRLTISLHWLTLLVLAGVYAAIELRIMFPKGSGIREAFKTWHFMLGLLILLIMLVRLAARLMRSAPPITPPPPIWQYRASRAMHAALYGLLLAMPIAGWAMLSASGAPIPFFGLELPPLVAPDKQLAAQIKAIHTQAGTIGYWLIGMHAAAALYHHHILKDDTLRRILPGRH